MTASSQELHFADAGEAADLAAFLARLIHYDRAAAVRLQAGGGVLAVFGRPPSFEVLAIRTARLDAIVGTEATSGTSSASGTSTVSGTSDTSGTSAGAAGGPGALDTTVSAGEFADALDTARAGRTADGPSQSHDRGLAVTVPQAVTGPPWAGVLPPRGGWRRVSGLPGVDEVRGAVAAAVAEFRARDTALPEERRTRTERDRIGREIWTRTLGDTGLPLRAVHAAQSLGFLRPVRAAAPAATAQGAGGRVATAAPDAMAEPLALLAAGGWLRLRTPYGSIAVRTSGLSGLSVTPA
ncbi:hypothetical protein GCM10009548_00490 [Streptomyces malaysiensis subsp. malaysiensis]|uniref:Uncharacterized protein n=1 Tax=Streptomyces malaysiensis TaxID=92644 RepID=A0ABX6W4Y0_STRMQ|nr:MULTISPECIES: hypothetical protein [Streptomyces]QPI56454.1 hypothetical protein I1A49_17295 [Streptomyces solisilvae]UHH17945.1 hypothetical protein LUV23_17405 [Streptomyces sp. HNM0561]